MVRRYLNYKLKHNNKIITYHIQGCVIKLSIIKFFAGTKRKVSIIRYIESDRVNIKKKCALFILVYRYSPYFMFLRQSYDTELSISMRQVPITRSKLHKADLALNPSTCLLRLPFKLSTG